LQGSSLKKRLSFCYDVGTGIYHACICINFQTKRRGAGGACPQQIMCLFPRFKSQNSCFVTQTAYKQQMTEYLMQIETIKL